VVFVSNALENKKDVLDDDEEYYNFNVVDTENDEQLIYYDCLADSVTATYLVHVTITQSRTRRVHMRTLGSKP